MFDESIAPFEWNCRDKAESVAAGLEFVTRMGELNAVSVFLRDDDAIQHLGDIEMGARPIAAFLALLPASAVTPAQPA